MVNPHDIDGMKDRILTAVQMDTRDQRKRMRRLRRRVLDDDVAKWSQTFLSVLAAVPSQGHVAPEPAPVPAEVLS
jgi:trehalose 6-phosphate synthase